MKQLCLLSIIMLMQHLHSASFGSLPAGWSDFYIGACDDGTKTEVLRSAIQQGTRLDYRYRYLNGGLNPQSNWWSWGTNGSLVTDYLTINSTLSSDLKACWVIYMLQEEGGIAGFRENIANPAKTKEYLREIAWVADKSKGKKAVFVIEPDTWGYFIQSRYHNHWEPDSIRNEHKLYAAVNNLGAEYSYLSDLPNNVSGLVQAIIRTVRRNASDAYVGLHANYWSIWVNGTASGNPNNVDGQNGMVYWDSLDVKFSAEYHADFFKSVTGAIANQSADRGDFIVVEKYGLDAGASLPNRWNYWQDKHFRKYLYWCKTLGVKLNLPVLGWQIPVGHIGLPNIYQRYEDVYLEYFFSHVQDFIDHGFIGLFIGPGVGQSTQFSVLNGQGDNGWAVAKIREFDQSRPYFSSNINDNSTSKPDLVLNIYPNPANSTSVINLKNQQRLAGAIVLYNANGQLIKKIADFNRNDLFQSYRFDSSGLNSGIYFIKAYSAGQVVSLKTVLLK